MDMKSEFLGKINRDNSNNTPLLGGDPLSGIHKKILNQVKGVKTEDEKAKLEALTRMLNREQEEPQPKTKAEMVIQADLKFRDALKELAINLDELGDNAIAQKLIGEHIIMLSNIYKHFE